MTDTAQVSRDRQRPEDQPGLVDADLADQLLARAKAQGGWSCSARRAAFAGDESGAGAGAGRGADRAPQLRPARPGRAGVGELPQRQHSEAAADRGRPGRVGGAAGSGRQLRPADRTQGAVPAGRVQRPDHRPPRPRHDDPRHPASVLLDAGESIKALSEYLGHSDPGFTLRTYTPSHAKQRTTHSPCHRRSPDLAPGVGTRGQPPSRVVGRLTGADRSPAWENAAGGAVCGAPDEMRRTRI